MHHVLAVVLPAKQPASSHDKNKMSVIAATAVMMTIFAKQAISTEKANN